MEAQSGIIRVDGTVLKEESVYDIRDKIGIVFPESRTTVHRRDGGG